MSPKNQVLSLSYISLKFVSTSMVHRLSDDEGLCYDGVERYLQDATYEVLQDLLRIILNAENLNASTRFSCLQTMLREDIRRLDTGVFPHSYYEKILEVISLRACGLQHLNLKGVWLRDYPKLLSKVLSKLKNLKILVIPHMPDDAVLQATIGCGQLSVLDVSGECNFTLKGLAAFKSPTLKVLSVGMYGNKCLGQENGEDSVEAVAGLLKNLPNLNVLKTYSYAGSALLRIYLENPGHRTKLRYIHDTGTTAQILEAVASLCPDLESVNFNAPEARVLPRLNRLSCLKTSEATVEDLVEYCNGPGANLQVLKLNVLRGSSLDLSQIAVLTPELTTLECYKSKLIYTNPDNYFINLQSVEILYCDVSNSVIRHILQNSPFLRRVVVGDVIRMTDGDVFRLCAECDFHWLEELWFSCAKGLTVTSVELLMGHCPNLKVLGQLNGWDVSVGDIEYLRALILSTNTDLALLPIVN